MLNIYLLIGGLLALFGYCRDAPNYNFLSAALLTLGWPLFVIIFIYKNAR